MKNFLVIILIAVLIGGGVWGYIYYSNENVTAGTVSVDINPSVEFVYNQNNRVTQVNFNNEDAESLGLKSDFVGLDVTDACNLVVELSAKANFIDVTYEGSTLSNQVRINVRALNNANIEGLRNRIVNRLNLYFDENGIYGLAKAEDLTTLTAEAEALDITLNKYQLIIRAESLKVVQTRAQLLVMTEEQLLELVKDYSDKYSKISASLISTLLTGIETIKTGLAGLATLPATIATLREQLAASGLSQTEIDAINDSLDTAQMQYDNAILQFEEDLDELIEDLEEQSESLIEDAITAGQALIEDNSTQFEQHKNAFRNGNNKQERIDAIHQWRTDNED